LRLRHGHADKAFHVASATAKQAAITNLGFKRITGPYLPVDRHHIGVARQDHAPRPLTEGCQQIGFGARFVVIKTHLRARRFEPVGGPFNQCQIGVSAYRIKANQGRNMLDHLGRRGLLPAHMPAPYCYYLKLTSVYIASISLSTSLGVCTRNWLSNFYKFF